ncbi:MAG: transporter [Ruminococcaceae bacterium]|nr:transporter [Oscillospiraceae bacterium]
MERKLKLYIRLHIFLLIYSVGGILSKMAAGKGFMSPAFILLYAGEILILAFYALGWQQFIKCMPLSVAYANKAVTVIWGCIWGALIFHEHLTAGKVIGGLLVLYGIALFGYADGKSAMDKKADET